ncbi:hypothetical protein [Pedobacter metabolipauper]|uniref:Uncharacterized protein n=1 Tax=Pedobacter metabolipauper TaxID=425513 RepID=A0A4R6SUN9_9SPHI|nr:hypothetical protein [Pedobacter metabolipauper]TDQ08726.1 hypothetical protein ATK78_3244 [Pedobacter metabolipauper]
MQHIQDKEFDQLFKDRFEHAEIQPGRNLWDGIEAGIAPKLRKRILPAYWMAAAVVFIAVTVGVLVPKTEKIQLHGQPLAAYTESPVIPADHLTSGSSVNGSVLNKPSAPDAVNSGSAGQAAESTPLVIAPRLTDADVKKDFIPMQPISKPDRPVNTGSEMVKPAADETPVRNVVPAKELMIASAASPVDRNVITDLQSGKRERERESAREQEPERERKGIKNVGDLINLVVNKVDKRDQKIIQFNTDDDDNSSLIAINIGILKFNKKAK